MLPDALAIDAAEAGVTARVRPRRAEHAYAIDAPAVRPPRPRQMRGFVPALACAACLGTLLALVYLNHRGHHPA